MTSIRLPKDPGPAGWNRLLPVATPARVLESRIKADWLVIGAGFAGLAAARRLAQLDPSGRIVILDAVRVGDGPAGRNSGFMIDLPHDLASDDYGGAIEADKVQTKANRHAIEFAANMAEEFGLDGEAFDRSGKINAAATAKGHQHNLEYARHLVAMGEDHQLLSAAQMRDVTGIEYYRSGLFTPGSAMIQPAKFVRGVAAGVCTNRVALFENSPVTALDKDGDWIARTPKGQVTAPKVILAVNGHLNSFGFLRSQLMHVFTYASMTRALSDDEVTRLGGDRVWGVTPADPMGTTVRKISGVGGTRIVIRNRFTFDPSLEVSEHRIARVGRDHDRAFHARFAMLRGVEMQYRWGGRLCLSRNNVQVISQLDRGLYSACCQNGLGTAKGTLAGIAAAELATGELTDLGKALSTQDPPKHLPPRPIASLGAAAILKWQEFRAGQEL